MPLRCSLHTDAIAVTYTIDMECQLCREFAHLICSAASHTLSSSVHRPNQHTIAEHSLQKSLTDRHGTGQLTWKHRRAYHCRLCCRLALVDSCTLLIFSLLSSYGFSVYGTSQMLLFFRNILEGNLQYSRDFNKETRGEVQVAHCRVNVRQQDAMYLTQSTAQDTCGRRYKVCTRPECEASCSVYSCSLSWPAILSQAACFICRPLWKGS